MFNKIKDYFTKKSPPHFVVCELSFEQLLYLNSTSKNIFPYISSPSLVQTLALIRDDLLAIQQEKRSQYLNYTSISGSEVRLMLNFEQLCLLYLPVCLAYPEWEYEEKKGLSSLAMPFVLKYVRHLYQLTNFFTEVPSRPETHIKLTLSENDFRHLYTNVVWYTMTSFRYINYGKDLDWIWDEMFTLILEEISHIGLNVYPEKISPQRNIFDLVARLDWDYPMEFRESVAFALKNYHVASRNTNDHLSCFNCSSSWKSDDLKSLVKCPNCGKSFLNPYYLNRVKDKELKGTGTWCMAYEKNSDNSVTLSLHLEHFFMLLIIVLTSPSDMHIRKEKLEVFNFEKDTHMKKLFIKALCNLLE
jgi:hypothetical protein